MALEPNPRMTTWDASATAPNRSATRLPGSEIPVRNSREESDISFTSRTVVIYSFKKVPPVLSPVLKSLVQRICQTKRRRVLETFLGWSVVECKWQRVERVLNIQAQIQFGRITISNGNWTACGHHFYVWSRSIGLTAHQYARPGPLVNISVCRLISDGFVLMI